LKNRHRLSHKSGEGEREIKKKKILPQIQLAFLKTHSQHPAHVYPFKREGKWQICQKHVFLFVRDFSQDIPDLYFVTANANVCHFQSFTSPKARKPTLLIIFL
jgi:hypothetical protein